MIKAKTCAKMKTTAMAARKVLRRHGKSFYWASGFLPPESARRAARLYAFCRYVDDVADEDDPPTAQLRLQHIRRELQAGVSTDPVVSDMLDLM